MSIEKGSTNMSGIADRPYDGPIRDITDSAASTLSTFSRSWAVCSEEADVGMMRFLCGSKDRWRETGGEMTGGTVEDSG